MNESGVQLRLSNETTVSLTGSDVQVLIERLRNHENRAVDGAIALAWQLAVYRDRPAALGPGAIRVRDREERALRRMYNGTLPG